MDGREMPMVFFYILNIFSGSVCIHSTYYVVKIVYFLL